MAKTTKSKMFKLLAMIMAAIMLMSAMMVQAFAEKVIHDANATLLEEEMILSRASVMDTDSGQFEGGTARAIIAYFSDTNDYTASLSFTYQATRMVMTIYGEYYDGTHPARRTAATAYYDRYGVRSVSGSVDNSSLPMEYTDAICGYTHSFIVQGEVTSRTYIPQVDL